MFHTKDVGTVSTRADLLDVYKLWYSIHFLTHHHSSHSKVLKKYVHGVPAILC